MSVISSLWKKEPENIFFSHFILALEYPFNSEFLSKVLKLFHLFEGNFNINVYNLLVLQAKYLY